MLANGVPPKVAAERLGHADATLFTNLYSHVTPTMQREAADKLGAALFGGGRRLGQGSEQATQLVASVPASRGTPARVPRLSSR
jgi:hypothetical protein